MDRVVRTRAVARTWYGRGCAVADPDGPPVPPRAAFHATSDESRSVPADAFVMRMASRTRSHELVPKRDTVRGGGGRARASVRHAFVLVGRARGGVGRRTSSEQHNVLRRCPLARDPSATAADGENGRSVVPREREHLRANHIVTLRALHEARPLHGAQRPRVREPKVPAPQRVRLPLLLVPAQRRVHLLRSLLRLDEQRGEELRADGAAPGFRRARVWKSGHAWTGGRGEGVKTPRARRDFRVGGPPARGTHTHREMSSSSAPEPDRVGVPMAVPVDGEERTGVGGATPPMVTSAAVAAASSMAGASSATATAAAAARSDARFFDGKKKSVERDGSRAARTASATATPWRK